MYVNSKFFNYSKAIATRNNKLTQRYNTLLPLSLVFLRNTSLVNTDAVEIVLRFMFSAYFLCVCDG